MNPLMKASRWICLLLALLLLASACQPAQPPLDRQTPPPAPDQPAATIVSNSASTPATQPASTQPSATLRIIGIADNRGIYPDGQVPAHEKLEITFQVEGSLAGNFFMPYDPAPPSGIDLHNPSYQGTSVDALFTPDGWQTVYRQPAFYYQDFLHERRPGREWLYPSGEFTWMARFSPPAPGDWQYRLVALDASGAGESEALSFSVAPSADPGFIRVSTADRRYFEFDNGDYFPALGFNLTARQISAENPGASSQAYFQKLSQNGIDFARLWLSAWGIYGSAWNPWRSITPTQSEGYLPFTGLTLRGANQAEGSEASMIVNARVNPCMFIGWESPPPAVEPDTTYRIRLRYKLESIGSPRQAGAPYGLVAKIGGQANGSWLWGEGINCNDSGTGIVVSDYASQPTADQPDPWRTLEGTWQSGDAEFLPYFYLVLENVDGGRAYIDRVWIEADLGGGQFGPNILPKPWMSHHLYVDQRSSFAFDQVIEAAHQSSVYLKLVVLEKDGWILNRILPDGSSDEDASTNDNFYGDGREVTKTRWLMQAWWRYLQARWGYSPNIHSWELLNEGDPTNPRHYVLADEFGKFMHCRVFGAPVGAGDGEACTYQHPNSHLVTTSFWHSYPLKSFWVNPNHPNIDYADLHAYVSTGWIEDPALPFDSAAYHIEYSQAARRGLLNAAGDAMEMPLVRGEAGLDAREQQMEQPELANDVYGVWLHNFVWASLDPGGLIELYWWNDNLERQPGPDGLPGLHEVYAPFAEFIQDIPLNNGLYRDAEASLTNTQLRAVGQKDTQNNRAHLWVQNRSHTWREDRQNTGAVWGLGGELRLEGFTPGLNLPVTWYAFDTQGAPTVTTSTASVDASGAITLPLPDEPFITDAGIKIGAQ